MTRLGVPSVPRVIATAIAVALAFIVGAGITSSGAVFTDTQTASLTMSAGRIFTGTRTTSGFQVQDTSGGSSVDRTSPFAVDGDGRVQTTSAWPVAFAAGNFFQLDFNSPLPSGLSASGVALNLDVASTSVSGTYCAYVEVRSSATNALLATYGSSGSPVVCATGSSFSSIVLPLPVVTGTDAANHLRIRLLGQESSGAAAQVDLATVSGSSPYAAFTLYPVRTTDAANGDPITTPWELQGP